jgi:L-threonylcarbamoyladenylate synthase
MTGAVSPRDLARAVAALRAGELVAFPTETVYGLGADASSASSLRHLYAVKGRPADHPVIVHLGDARGLDAWAASVPDPARRLADRAWPGPLTLVLPRAPGVLDEVTGGQGTVGLRVPDQPVALALLRAFDGGVAAPSANRFGRVSPTTAADVHRDLGDDVAVVLDGGPCRVGVESTIVDCSTDTVRVLRVGGLPVDVVSAIAGVGVELDTDAQRGARAPGTLESHYAPHARVEVVPRDDVVARVDDARRRGERVGVIAAPDGAVPDGVVVLGSPDSDDEYARTLYRMLRAADEQALDVVVAVAPDGEGIGAAVADRLRRAAAPRPIARNRRS